jgi:ABC-type transport system substrate-binding protein
VAKEVLCIHSYCSGDYRITMANEIQELLNEIGDERLKTNLVTVSYTSVRIEADCIGWL